MILKLLKLISESLLKKTAKLLSSTFQPYENVENSDLAQYLEETTKLKYFLRLSHLQSI